MPPHQMPAANPEPERLADATSVKTIQTKVNYHLDPAVPVRTYAVACSPLQPSRAARTPPIAQENTASPIA